MPIILVNAWRHVSAVLTAIFRQTYSTDQVQIVRIHNFCCIIDLNTYTSMPKHNGMASLKFT
jgi:hypothetical protein